MMQDKIKEFETRMPQGFAKHELLGAVGVCLEEMSDQEIIETVLAELLRIRKEKRDDYLASKMETIING